MFTPEVFQLLITKVYAPRRISNHRVEATGFHNFRELGIPIENVDTVALFVVEEAHLLVFVKVRADEGVAAFDVVAEVGEGARAEELEVLADGFFGFTFENFQQKAQLGDFDGLAVDVHAVDVVEQNALFLLRGQEPLAA